MCHVENIFGFVFTVFLIFPKVPSLKGKYYKQKSQGKYLVTDFSGIISILFKLITILLIITILNQFVRS